MIGHLTLWTVTGSGVPVSSMDVTLTISDISMAHCWPILLSRSRSVTSPEKEWPWSCKKKLALSYHQVKARRALLQFKDVLLRTRRVLSLYKVYGDRALLVFNGTSLNCNNALLALNWRYVVWNNKHNLWSVIKCWKLGWAGQVMVMTISPEVNLKIYLITNSLPLWKKVGLTVNCTDQKQSCSCTVIFPWELAVGSLAGLSGWGLSLVGALRRWIAPLIGLGLEWCLLSPSAEGLCWQLVNQGLGTWCR